MGLSKDEVVEGTQITGCTVMLIILAIIIITAVVFGGVYLSRYYYSMERTAIKQSLPYKEGKTAQLMNLAEEYRKLDVQMAKADGELRTALKGQQTAIVAQMKMIRQQMDNKDIPVDVHGIISMHK